MRRIVHISDLHFGNNDPALLAPLRSAIQELQPQLLVVSGDLVEHASRVEFQDARQFLATLPAPQIVVPGNHDLPFYNLGQRAVAGLSLYRNHITRDMQPRYEDEEVAVIGANTSRIWPIRGGSLSSLQLNSLAAEFAGVPASRVRVLVTHHPFDLPPQQNRRLLVGHARRSICRLAPIVDILLAGHIHLSSTGSTAKRYRTAGHALAFVQAGTAVSRRDKGEQNSFNSLDVFAAGPDSAKRARILTWTWQRAEYRFACRCSTEFRLESEGWTRQPENASQPAQATEEEVYEESETVNP